MKDTIKKIRSNSQLTWRIMVEYLFSLFFFQASIILFVMLSWRFTQCFVWYADDPVYRVLNLIKDFLIPILGVLFLGGWLAITWYFLSRPLRYLNEIVKASGKLAQPAPEPIVLPNALKNVQNELNLVREESLRNALIAREAEQRKNDLIVYLAHDLKTPLTSVIGYLTLLSDEPQISEEVRARYIGIARKKAERLEELINEFFDITRFSLMSLTLEPERINFSRMLEQVISEFEPVLAEKELTWDVDIEPDVEILCDPDKLERVIDNLVRNALGYSYPGTAIHLSLHRTPPESASGAESGGTPSDIPAAGAPSSPDTVCLQVKNHGRTISPEKLTRIFDQFFRLDTSRASSTGGAGLGLAIAKEIVTLHGGTIQAESESESILFTVILPTEGRT